MEKREHYSAKLRTPQDIPQNVQETVIKNLITQAFSGRGEFFFVVFDHQGRLKDRYYSKTLTAAKLLDIADFAETTAYIINKSPIKRHVDGTRRTHIRNENDEQKRGEEV